MEVRGLIKRNGLAFILGVLLIISGVTALATTGPWAYHVNAWAPLAALQDDKTDHQTGFVVTIKDKGGSIVSMAARGVVRGDEIINAEGYHYRVAQVKGSEAQAELLGKDKELLAYSDYFDKLEIPASVTAAARNKVVGIYHSHSDESYVPTDGTEAIPFKGGIYKVGQALVSRLRNENVKVDYDKTPHDPHDNNAYQRSRRTAARLLKSNPVALIDVHRDGIPDPQYYKKEISNEDVARLRLVVGRQNPQMSANLDFAKKMMAYANKTHPGIVKEIFMAKGNYNQDLMPTALLIEAGTHTNSRQEAANGVALFADAIPTVLGISTTPGGGAGGLTTGAGPARSGGAWKALAWILGIALLAGGAFLLVSSGGLGKAKSRVSSFMDREFTGFFGPRKPIGSTGLKKNGDDKNKGKLDPDENEILRDNFKKTR
ncbi:MAG: stage II sporulation protein P [Peptococcaceae bacterium BRH_c4b]|nr:MAG: stage II sporulation protein P [Peptococcaceae bacterium BRH_c4b]